MEEEIQGLLEREGFEVLYTGVGKINAAHHLTKALVERRSKNQFINLVLNFGTAGSSKFATHSLVECTTFIQRDMDEITAGPNPVKDVLNIRINGKAEAAYEITLVSMNGQTIMAQTTARSRTANLQIPRTTKMTSGMYILKIKNLGTGYIFTKKMLFE
ncbi:MAG: T9SS type A sorting domain-containing protein [Chitinophagaceae bacterium]|nr:MAG: T9SS type A sorting domain-containing protein [Chitinophagaceae bacterium]